MAGTASTDLIELDSQSPGILPGMTSLAPLKQVGILIALAASIALGVFIALWSNDPPMRPLENLSPESSMDVINYLEQQQIPYDIDNMGRVLVPQSGYQRIQMELGSQGIEVQNNLEDPYLKKDSGFGVSQRMEQARLLRNQEIRLTNTLQQFNGVKAVKVHLAIPKESSFIKNRRKPSASVLLNLFSRGGLSDEQVDAMVDLVSGSIPNLERNRVTITDQFGRLYHSGSMTETSRQTSKELKIVRERQADIKSRIEEILTPLVGATAYTVQVNVDMDFTQKEQTLQTFNPDLPAVRSERTIDDSRTAAAVAGVPGALTNQPPGAANIPANNPPAGGNDQTSNANKRLEAERNFELDTTISHILPQVGVINRISASIGLDHVADPANQGQRIPRPQDEIARITRLVQAAIGFNTQRGDLVSVESFPFTAGETLPTPTPPAFYEDEMFLSMIQPLLGLIAFILLIFVVLKPMMQKLSTPAPVAASKESQASDDLDLAALTGELGGGEAGLAEDQVVLSGHDNLELPPPTVGEVKKLEQAKGVVANNPTLVAQLVKSWIEEDG